jgi:hypothetical protein
VLRLRIAANGGLCRPRPRGALLCRPIEYGRVSLAVAQDRGGGMLYGRSGVANMGVALKVVFSLTVCRPATRPPKMR